MIVTFICLLIVRFHCRNGIVFYAFFTELPFSVSERISKVGGDVKPGKPINQSMKQSMKALNGTDASRAGRSQRLWAVIRFPTSVDRLLPGGPARDKGVEWGFILPLLLLVFLLLYVCAFCLFSFFFLNWKCWPARLRCCICRCY